jgi:glycosyltransferase involved in cell wall biosynthesis
MAREQGWHSDDGRARIAAANRRYAQAQDRALWADFAAAARGAGGVRGVLRATAAVARALTEPSGPAAGDAPPPLRPIARARATHEYADWVAVTAGDRAPLVPVTPGGGPLHVAFVVLPFGYGSGGHEVVFRTIAELEHAGHTCSLWFDDPFGFDPAPPSVLRRRIRDDFAIAIDAPLHRGFEDWFGADVAVATGWQTVWPLLRRGGCGARAYLVNDDETTFYAESIERRLAAATYDEDLYRIAGTRWMLERIQARHGGEGGHFDYPVAPAYHPRPVAREPATIVLYGRTVTERRAVGLAVMALEELIDRRGHDLRVVMFGDEHPLPAPFAYEFAGLVRPERLAWLYSMATVGIAMSMTNASLVPQDMGACGLPCVELDVGAAADAYPPDGSVELAPFDAIGLADAVERLLADPQLRDRRAEAGLARARERTWERTGAQIVDQLQTALDRAQSRLAAAR